MKLKTKKMEKEQMLKYIRSIILFLMAHPDNEQDSEMADRISDLKRIEFELRHDLLKKSNVEWELFLDYSYYDMFCVKPKEDKLFNSPRRFYFNKKEDAERFKQLIESCHCAIPSETYTNFEPDDRLLLANFINWYNNDKDCHCELVNEDIEMFISAYKS